MLPLGGRNMYRALGVVCVLVGLALGQVAWADSFESHRMGGLLVGRFTNETGSTVDGLLLVFSEPVAAPNWLVIGGDLELVSNADGQILFEGSLLPYGTLVADWPGDGPQLTQAVWLVDGDAVEYLCISCPTAQISFLPMRPLVGDLVQFTASGSFDSAGEALVRYLWEWSDGPTEEGETTERTFTSSGQYEVTLTVWNTNLQTGSRTMSFSVAEVFELAVQALGGPGTVTGPGISCSNFPPPGSWPPNDCAETYAEGTYVVLTASPVLFSSWAGCSSTSGTECTVIMDADKTVSATFLVCFAADTHVVMADGLRKRIADVRVGDRVMAYDFTTGQRVGREVTRTFHSQAAGFLRINDLEVTASHRFAVGPDEWVTAGQLKIGDRVLHGDGFTLITHIQQVDEPATVFTLTIEGAHNFLVSDGKNLYLVHNVK
jgi:PKD repeat protein